MDTLFIAFIAALGYLIILCKIFSPRAVAKSHILWDVAFTLGMPLLFIGTYSGMVTAFLSGVVFSAMSFVLSILHR
jgi:hypothetical protein